MSGFLPPFFDLHSRNYIKGLHTLYISPLKALTNDIERNISIPINELKLPIKFETRTGDTPNTKRIKQKIHPPHFLMTTPESLALMISYENSNLYFKNVKFIIIDEIHSFFDNKRGDLLSLLIERIQSFSPLMIRIGLSATIGNKIQALNWLCRKKPKIVMLKSKSIPKINIIKTTARIPWSGFSPKYAIHGIYKKILRSNKSLVFVNTRSQAETVFQELWKINKYNLKIAIHHSSLEKTIRNDVEKKMSNSELDSVVTTSSLDLGIDWANIDLVFQIGAPKGINRLLQRIGRSNHKLDSPSNAILVPTNRFEYLECFSAINEIKKNKLDNISFRKGGYDVLAQHIFCIACSEIINIKFLYSEIVKAYPYNDLTYKKYLQILNFVKNGGYSLKNYSQYNRLKIIKKGNLILTNKNFVKKYRMNIGTIVESPLLKIKSSNITLGKIEENFILNLSNGDNFIFGGNILKFIQLKNSIVYVSKSKDNEASVPTYIGGKLPLSTNLGIAVSKLIYNENAWHFLPSQIVDWLKLQSIHSKLPSKRNILIESFPFKSKFYIIIYTFEGRNVNETLGFLLIKRLLKLNLKPIGFTINDYSLVIWSLSKIINIYELFDQNLIKEELNDWLNETPLLRKLFRDTAVISGLVERRFPGLTKTGRQVLFNTDLIFDVLTKYEPNHILIDSIKRDALHSLIDINRLKNILCEIRNSLVFVQLNKISPMAVPLILQANRENLPKNIIGDELLNDFEELVLKEANVISIS